MLKRRLKEPFGKAGLTVAILALVLAMVGGAWAAVGLNSKQKKEVTKIAKKYAGKPGAPGAPGSAGPQGGPGAAGTNGTNGTSPAGTPFTGSKTLGSVTCTEGGTEYKGATTNLVCNGKKGTNGTTGFTETLPSGATETGAYIDQALFTTISFSIPLATALDGGHVHYLPLRVWKNKIGAGAGELCAGKSGAELTACKEPYEQLQASCPGTIEAPEALEGHLCLYESESSSPAEGAESVIFFKFAGTIGASTAGSLLLIETLAAEPRFLGTWAVTG